MCTCHLACSGAEVEAHIVDACSACCALLSVTRSKLSSRHPSHPLRWPWPRLCPWLGLKATVPPALQVHWLRVILDEGHKIGGLAMTNKLQMATAVHAERRWVMTGAVKCRQGWWRLARAASIVSGAHERSGTWLAPVQNSQYCLPLKPVVYPSMGALQAHQPPAAAAPCP